MKRGYLEPRLENKHPQKFIIARTAGGAAFIGIAVTVVVAAGLIAAF